MNALIANLNLVPTPGTANDEALAVDATGGGVQFASITSSALNDSTRFIILDVQDADVRVTFDGSAPTASNGHLLPQGTSVAWKIATARAAKFIRAASTDAVVHASQFTY